MTKNTKKWTDPALSRAEWDEWAAEVEKIGARGADKRAKQQRVISRVQRLLRQLAKEIGEVAAARALESVATQEITRLERKGKL